MVDLISTFLGGTRFFGYWSSPQRYGNQFRVKSRQDVVNLLNTYNGVYNCGISICSYLGEVPYLLYLPFDFDSYNLEESWVDAKKFYNFMVKSGYDISIQSSIIGSTPMLIKIKDKIKLYSIKEVIHLLKSSDKVEVLSLDNDTIKFSPIYNYLQHKDNIYKLYYEQSNIPIKLTNHHSLYVWDNSEIKEVDRNGICEGSYIISFHHINHLKFSNPTKIKHSFHSCKKERMEDIDITNNLLKLIGYYMAEGHVLDRGDVGFSFNANELEYHDEVEMLIKTLKPASNLKKKSFNVCKRLTNKNKSGMQIIFSSQKFRTFFEEYCGKGSENKHVPSFLFNMDKQRFKLVLQSYLNGDGSYKGKFEITSKTISKQLAQELLWLCKIHGITCRISKELGKGNNKDIYILHYNKAEYYKLERGKFSHLPNDLLIPIDALKQVYHQCKPKQFNSHRNEQMTLSKERASYKRILKVIDWFNETKSIEYNSHSKRIIENYKRIITKGELSFLKIKRIVDLKDEHIVYDISVNSSENFFGGVYPILLHNSGYRGFHCLVSTIPNLYSKRQIRQAQQWFKDLLHLETCDTAIFGDWRRLIRIPGTLHCGKFIKDKNKKWKRLGEGSYCKVIKYNEGKLFDLNEYFEDDFPDYEFSAVSNNKPLHSYPCVDDVLDNYKDEFGRREPPQLIRYSYVAYWLRSGKTPKEIYKMLEDRHSIGKEYEWYDWDDDITMNQIIHISGRGDDYHPLKCETIKSLGFCLENKCRYFIDDWKVKSVRDII